MKLRPSTLIWFSCAAVALLVVSAFLNIVVPVQRRHAAISALENAQIQLETQSGGWNWLRDWFGDERMRVFDDAVSAGGAISGEWNDELFAHLQALPNLESVEVHESMLSDDGLASLRRLSRLKTLFFFNVGVTDRGLPHIGNCTALQELRLSATDVTDAGLASLRDLVELRELDLSSTNVTDDGLVHLKGLTRLNRVNLSQTQVTEAGLKHLERLPNLQKLVLEETPGMAVLLHAIESGQVSAVKSMLTRRPLLFNATSPFDELWTLLIPAVEAEQVDVLRMLIERWPDAAGKAAILERALVVAAEKRGAQYEPDEPKQQIVRILQEAGAYYGMQAAIHLDDPDRVRELLKADPSPVSDLRFVEDLAKRGRVAILKLLLREFRIAPNRSSLRGVPLLFHAIEHAPVLELLLEAGADPLPQVSEVGIWDIHINTITLLHAAARADAVDSARILLARGAPVDAGDEFGDTPLLAAAAGRGEAGIVRLLLEHGADPHAVDVKGVSAMAHAVERGSRPIIEALSSYGVPIDLFAAIALDDPRRVTELAQANPALLTIPSRTGSLPLHYAVEKGAVRSMAALLEAGAPIDGRNKSNLTALHLAALIWPEKVRYLIESGASVDVRADSDLTPLMCAVTAGHELAVEALIAAGATVNAAADGMTALHRAAREPYPEVVRLLVAAGAAVNAKDKEGRTPLRVAGHRKDKDSLKTIEILTKAGGKR